MRRFKKSLTKSLRYGLLIALPLVLWLGNAGRSVAQETPQPVSGSSEPAATEDFERPTIRTDPSGGFRYDGAHLANLEALERLYQREAAKESLLLVRRGRRQAKAATYMAVIAGTLFGTALAGVVQGVDGMWAVATAGGVFTGLGFTLAFRSVANVKKSIQRFNGAEEIAGFEAQPSPGASRALHAQFNLSF